MRIKWHVVDGNTEYPKPHYTLISPIDLDLCVTEEARQRLIESCVREALTEAITFTWQIVEG